MTATQELTSEFPATEVALYFDPMDIDSVILSDPAKVPDKLEKIDDETLISVSVWARFQGVKTASVLSNRVKSERRRADGTPKPGDMPPADEKIGPSPYWKMSTYRAWEAGRPGKGAGAGRPKGSGKKLGPRKVELPFNCPHCGNEITSTDLVDQTGAN